MVASPKKRGEVIALYHLLLADKKYNLTKLITSVSSQFCPLVVLLYMTETVYCVLFFNTLV